MDKHLHFQNYEMAIYYMIESKFQKQAFLLAFITILFVSTFIWIGYNDVSIFNPNTPIIFIIFFSTIFALVIIKIFWGELRKKAIKVYIEHESISKKGFLGLGPLTKYEISNISGYTTSILYSRGGNHEYLYLFANNKKIIIISEYYHLNYKELKSNIINKRIKNFGVEQSSFVKETLEIFS